MVKSKTKKTEQRYCWTEKQREAAIQEFSGDRDPDKAVTITRYKGLGEMNPEQLWETTMSPENRMLRQVTIENSVAADAAIAMLMGEDVPPRRKFIEENAKYANLDV